MTGEKISASERRLFLWSPPGHYFVLGDNLDNSTDSRMLSAIGYVPFENLAGRAEFICFSLRRDEGRYPQIRLGRTGRTIR